MKDTKEVFLKIRLTKEEKEKLADYAERHETTMSEVIRNFCYDIFNAKEA